MKQSYIMVALLAMAGCANQSYHSTKVGPDRFVISSHGHDTGPENYSKILEKAYQTCLDGGYKDYNITSSASENKRVLVFVQCESEKKAATEEKKPEDNSNSLTAELRKFYDAAKKKLAGTASK